MPWTTALPAAADVATVAAVFISLVLLRQGQQDRRDIRQAQTAEHARRVWLAVSERWVPADEGSASLEGWELHVRNDGDLPILMSDLELVETDSWQNLLERGERYLRTENVHLAANTLFPRSSRVFSRDVHAVDQLLPNFAILRFTDYAGNTWRRRSDTGELEPAGRTYHWWQRTFQRFATRGPLAWCMTALSRRVVRSSHRRGPHVMTAPLRLYRFLWGKWGAGEGDPWLRPEGAPLLWGFAELPWTDSDMGHPENT